MLTLVQVNVRLKKVLNLCELLASYFQLSLVPVDTRAFHNNKDCCSVFIRATREEEEEKAREKEREEARDTLGHSFFPDCSSSLLLPQRPWFLCSVYLSLSPFSP